MEFDRKKTVPDPLELEPWFECVRVSCVFCWRDSIDHRKAEKIASTVQIVKKINLCTLLIDAVCSVASKSDAKSSRNVVRFNVVPFWT